jgi:hypothetical protein
VAEFEAQNLDNENMILPWEQREILEHRDPSLGLGQLIHIIHQQCEFLEAQKSLGLSVVSVLETRWSSGFSIGMTASLKGPEGSCPSFEGRGTIFSARFGSFCHFDPTPKLEGPLP